MVSLVQCSVEQQNLCESPGEAVKNVWEEWLYHYAPPASVPASLNMLNQNKIKTIAPICSDHQAFSSRMYLTNPTLMFWHCFAGKFYDDKGWWKILVKAEVIANLHNEVFPFCTPHSSVVTTRIVGGMLDWMACRQGTWANSYSCSWFFWTRSALDSCGP